MTGTDGDTTGPQGPARDEDPFVTHRGLLFTVAYELLGSAADAEDVVQESWLRWADTDRTQVRHPRAYLVRVVTRQALNRLRTLSRQREDYIGQWLPEPLLTTPDVADDVELAESVSLAMLTVLETLPPTERAVFVLREVFAVPYEEIAATLDKTPAAVRQIARRARAHVQARQPRTRVGRAEREQVAERFLAAVRGGDLDELLQLLAPDVVFVGDGGGVVRAVRRPVRGAQKVARLLAGGGSRVAIDGRTVAVNGAPGLWIQADGAFVALGSLELSDDGRITHIYSVNNPQKLTRTDRVVRFER